VKVRVAKLAACAAAVGCLVAASACAAPVGATSASTARTGTMPASTAQAVTTTPATVPAGLKHAVVRQAVTRRSVAAASATTPAATTSGAVGATDIQKGVGVWTFDGVNEALTRSGASWYYTWTPDHPGITTPRGTQFIPMIWGARDVTAAALGQVKGEGRYLLTFNEPDNGAQSNMTVSAALSLWPQLMATGMQLSSPAVANGAATPGGWLDQFVQGATSRGYRVNFIALHWYGGDFVTASAVAELRSYLQATYARYHLPIWLTEFALIGYNGGTAIFPTPAQQAAFLTAATQMLRGLSYVQRYSWFGLPATAGDGSAGLFGPGAVSTAAGRAFEAVP
jgi:Glycosyl hydrolase catalytic core